MGKNSYSPLLFLSALGAGGMTVSFFMYLMFIIPRNKEQFVIPTFNSLMQVWQNGGLGYQILIVIAIIGILFFAYKHFQLLIWNLINFFKFKKTEGYKNLLNTSSEVTLMAIPLTLAMSMSVLFTISAVFIPNLWSKVEYLFPIALAVFLAIGILAIIMFSSYFKKLLLNQLEKNIFENNSLNQLIIVFAFAMVGVGFSASAAMSTTKLTIGIGLIGSTFFLAIAVLFLFMFLIIGLTAVFKHGYDKANSPTIWVIIPFLTIMGITIMRQFHGIHSFGGEVSNATYLIFTTLVISIQIIFGILGYKMMKENKYFDEYVKGKEKNPGTYTLICPGVALVVFGFFFIHSGLIQAGILEKFSIMYFVLLVPLVLLQIKTILVMLKLNKKFYA